jgi:hypothetical protein
VVSLPHSRRPARPRLSACDRRDSGSRTTACSASTVSSCTTTT